MITWYLQSVVSISLFVAYMSHSSDRAFDSYESMGLNAA